MGSNSISNKNTKDEIRYLPESVVKVSIDMDEYLRLKEVESELYRLKHKQEVYEHTVCWDKLVDNLDAELDSLMCKYRGCMIWNLDSSLSGIISFYVKTFLESSPIAWDYDDMHKKVHRELKYAHKVLHYYFKKGDSWDERDVRCVKRALKFLRRHWFSMWT